MDAGFYHRVPVHPRVEIPILEVERDILQALDIDNHSAKSL
jgi:hypothetical protein